MVKVMDAIQIETPVVRWLLSRGNRAAITRFYPQGWWECDVYAITMSGYGIEVEVKVSRSDFFADRKKRFKHRILSGNGIASANTAVPRRFYYAVPYGLVTPDEVPVYAGLLYVDGTLVKIIKEAPPVKGAKKVTQRQLEVLSRAYSFHYYRLLYALAEAQSNVEKLRDQQTAEVKT